MTGKLILHKGLWSDLGIFLGVKIFDRHFSTQPRLPKQNLVIFNIAAPRKNNDYVLILLLYHDEKFVSN
jgi:hypothetical protein